jgi:Ca2+-binding EF-hand superfamily protein
VERRKYNTHSHSKRSAKKITISTAAQMMMHRREINHIKEIFHILDRKEKSSEISIELCIQGLNKNKIKTNHLLLELFDSGATGNFVKKTAFTIH